MSKYDNTLHWHFAAAITRCSRGAYLIRVDVGDEIESADWHWAAPNVREAKAAARRKAPGPIHWVDQRLNPDELLFGYVLRKHYIARLPLEETFQQEAIA